MANLQKKAGAKRNIRSRNGIAIVARMERQPHQIKAAGTMRAKAHAASQRRAKPNAIRQSTNAMNRYRYSSPESCSTDIGLASAPHPVLHDDWQLADCLTQAVCIK
jgi:hypothetical protein